MSFAFNKGINFNLVLFGTIYCSFSIYNSFRWRSFQESQVIGNSGDPLVPLWIVHLYPLLTALQETWLFISGDPSRGAWFINQLNWVLFDVCIYRVSQKKRTSEKEWKNRVETHVKTYQLSAQQLIWARPNFHKRKLCKLECGNEAVLLPFAQDLCWFIDVGVKTETATAATIQEQP